eukprot:TRINITY_DN93666_c0_g1_i1.p1 TRINITY_DN93666_c0_g1~~TRINITY_DN93666_c0_g1_i1.p1  ORF type:complete len:250 (+),score=55.83 TRINITY_DN93666_c0_g1_i1:23-751(+)
MATCPAWIHAGRLRRSPIRRVILLAAPVLLTILCRLNSETSSSFVGCSFARSRHMEDCSLQHRLLRGILRRAVTPDDEFRAARDKIRRIQLGLGPNDPLPEEGAEVAEAAPEEASTGDKPTDLDLAPEAKASKKGDEDDEDELPVVKDAFDGEEKDVPELKPSKPYQPKQVGGSNFAAALLADFQLITVPSFGEVAQTFGVVLLLVGLYTGFVALVDFGSQQALGSVFAEFYKAARPEAAEL